MDLQEFVANFADQFDETEPEEIQAETRFHEIEEWSSLTAMGIIAMVRTIYGKAITGRDIRTCESVEDLYNLVSSK